MKTEKIIIICPSMLPKMNMWGETQRMFYLANYLAEQGYRITVISPSYETKRKEWDIREQKYTNIYLGNIKRITPHGQMRTVPKPDNVLKKTKRLISSIANRFGEWYYGEQDITEIYRKNNWIRKYSNRICQIVSEENADKVIISMPSFTFIKLGRMIRNKCGNMKLIYDYRDPWYLWKRKRNPAYYREKFYLRYADCIIGFSERFCNDMIRDMKIDPCKVHTVYNGYSEHSWQIFNKIRNELPATTTALPKNKMIITYTGNMSLTDKKGNYRNPTNLIAAVRSVPNVELYLVGIAKIEKRIDEGNVHFIGEVTQQQSFLYMFESDILISIHDAQDSSGDYLISGKFYDYMRSGKIILQIGSSNGLMAEFVNRFGLGVVCENQVEKLQEVITALQEKWKYGELTRKTDNAQDIGKFAREIQNEAYRRYIDSI